MAFRVIVILSFILVCDVCLSYPHTDLDQPVTRATYPTLCCQCNDTDTDPTNNCDGHNTCTGSFHLCTEYCITVANYDGYSWKRQKGCAEPSTCQALPLDPCNIDMARRTISCTACCTSPSQHTPSYCMSSNTNYFPDESIVSTKPPSTTTETTRSPVTSSSTSTTEPTTTATTTESTTTATTTEPTTTTKSTTESLTSTSTRATTFTSTTSSSTSQSARTLPSVASACQVCGPSPGQKCQNPTYEQCYRSTPYCMNTVSYNADGTPFSIKKECISKFECADSYISQQSIIGCDPSQSMARSSTQYACHYCCDPRNTSTPCNFYTVPDNWRILDKTTPPPTLPPETTQSSTETTVPTAGHSSVDVNHVPMTTNENHMTSEQFVITTGENHVTSEKIVITTDRHYGDTVTSNAVPVTSDRNIGTSSTVLTSTPGLTHVPTTATETVKVATVTTTETVKVATVTTTETVKVATGTTTSPYTTSSQQQATQPGMFTLPAIPTICEVCISDNINYCESLYHPVECQPPNNYCINHLVNHYDGTKTVNRTCGNLDTCYTEWYLASSDSERCLLYDDKFILTLDFECTYCCIEDNCNNHIRPADETLYNDKRP